MKLRTDRLHRRTENSVHTEARSADRRTTNEHREFARRATRRMCVVNCGPKGRAAKPRVHLLAPTNLFEVCQIGTRRFLI
jgi:hypothetical protein